MSGSVESLNGYTGSLYGIASGALVSISSSYVSGSPIQTNIISGSNGGLLIFDTSNDNLVLTKETGRSIIRGYDGVSFGGFAGDKSFMFVGIGYGINGVVPKDLSSNPDVMEFYVSSAYEAGAFAFSPYDGTNDPKFDLGINNRRQEKFRNVYAWNIVSSSKFVSSTGFTGSLLGTSSWAVSASWAPGGGDWSSITGKPVGLVSQSAQISTWTSATASFVNASNITLGTLANGRLPTQISVTGLTGSLLGTSSWAQNSRTASFVTWTNVNSKPVGLVSQSAQISTWTSATASFVNASNITLGTLNNSRLPTQINVTGVTASLRGTSSWAVSASWAPGGSSLPDQINVTGITGSLYRPLLVSYTERVADFGNISGSMSVDYRLGNILHMAITDDSYLTITNAPTNEIEASTLTFIVENSGGEYDLFIHNSSFYGVDSTSMPPENETRIYNAVSFDGADWIVSYVDEGAGADLSLNWITIVDKPAGIVSQSAQIATWTAATASFVNASNITLGTLSNSRLPSQISITGVTSSLTGSVVNSAFSGYRETINALGNQSGTMNINCLLGNVVTCTLTGNITTLNISNAVPGMSLTIYATQNGTGDYDITFTNTKWSGGNAPEGSGANKIDLYSLFTIDGTNWIGTHAGDY